jgi:hypothetical protein
MIHPQHGTPSFTIEATERILADAFGARVQLSQREDLGGTRRTKVCGTSNRGVRPPGGTGHGPVSACATSSQSVDRHDCWLSRRVEHAHAPGDRAGVDPLMRQEWYPGT